MRPRIDIYLNSDGVNGDVEIVRSGDTYPPLEEIEIVIATGADGEVIFDSHPEIRRPEDDGFDDA